MAAEKITASRIPAGSVRSGSDKHGQIVPQRIKNGLSVPLRSNKLHPDVALSRLGQREQEGTGGYAGEPFGIGSPNNSEALIIRVQSFTMRGRSSAG